LVKILTARRAVQAIKILRAAAATKILLVVQAIKILPAAPATNNFLKIFSASADFFLEDL